MERIINHHHICLKCRRSVKELYNSRFWGGAEYLDTNRLPCAICHGEMYYVGKHFAPPRKNDDKQWKKLEWMILNGWRGYGWPTKPKMGLRETKNLINEVNEAEAKSRNKQKELEALENSKKVARYNFARSKTTQIRAFKELRKQEEYQTSIMKDLGLE